MFGNPKQMHMIEWEQHENLTTGPVIDDFRHS